MSFSYTQIDNPTGVGPFTFTPTYSSTDEVAVLGYDGKYWSELEATVSGQDVTLAASATGLQAIRISNNKQKKLNNLSGGNNDGNIVEAGDSYHNDLKICVEDPTDPTGSSPLTPEAVTIGAIAQNLADNFGQSITTLGDVTLDSITTDGTISQVSTETSFNDNRPVMASQRYKVQPSDPVQQTTDFHGVDIYQYTSGSNIGTASTRLYPFESTGRHNTADTLFQIVSGFFQWLNTSTGTVDFVRGLRLWGKNTGGGTINNATYIDIASPENSGGGSINNLKGIAIGEMSDVHSGAKGLDIAEPNNFMAGLDVDNIEVTKSILIDNDVEPVQPNNGGYLYVENGALKYKGSSGTVTTIANA